MYISQGRSISTGQMASGWTLNLDGKAPLKFRGLADAKAKAAELGFRGKWKREVRHTGARGAARIYYVPVEQTVA